MCVCVLSYVHDPIAALTVIIHAYFRYAMSPILIKFGFIIVGPLPETPRGSKYIITATDYFSKWPEAAPLPDKTAVDVAEFLFSLFCRHG